jgi:hypothetical protein
MMHGLTSFKLNQHVFLERKDLTSCPTEQQSDLREVLCIIIQLEIFGDMSLPSCIELHTPGTKIE